ncbi:MAG TPA: acyl-phosphate glycerol 3-phosphate acyltransferase [Desulfuromonas sp.]|nr:acyl-phosphate glycerol 3-phosphate acyltransferase [Desulfuromonas sp.]
MTLSLTFLLLAAYLVGAIPTGVLLTRLAGAGDIRQAGSGNIGATNVYRVAGRGLGIATLVGDALKGIVPLLVARALQLPPEQTALIAAAAFLGHLYPVYLGFKGGKGVATALGIFLVLSPATVALAALLFGLLLWKWRYVSLGSICAAAAAPPLVYFFTSSLPLLLASLFVAVMVIVRHRENIKRLLAGSENRFKA